jgi:hypothetical protein
MVNAIDAHVGGFSSLKGVSRERVPRHIVPGREIEQFLAVCLSSRGFPRGGPGWEIEQFLAVCLSSRSFPGTACLDTACLDER